MGLVSILKKNKAPLTKISLLMQIGEEIKAHVCSEDSTKILLNWIAS